MTKRFVLHYLEMVVAMLVGMVVLGPVWSFLLPGLGDHPDAAAMVMAADMSVGMALWMRVRRHCWAHIGEMCAAMSAPFVVLLVPYWLGLISGGTLMLVGHLLMFPAMLVPMVRRREGTPGRARVPGGSAT